MLCIQMRQMIVFCSVDFTTFRANCRSNLSHKRYQAGATDRPFHIYSTGKIIQRYVQDMCVILHKLILHSEVARAHVLLEERAAKIKFMLHNLKKLQCSWKRALRSGMPVTSKQVISKNRLEGTDGKCLEQCQLYLISKA